MCGYVVVYIYQAPKFALVLVCRFICLFFEFIYLFSMTLPQTEDQNARITGEPWMKQTSHYAVDSTCQEKATSVLWGCVPPTWLFFLCVFLNISVRNSRHDAYFHPSYRSS